MRVINKNGTLKPTRQLIDEARKRDEYKQIRLLNNEKFRNRGFIISDHEWHRLNKSIEKIKSESPSGAVKQFIVNNIFKKFNDEVLGPEEGETK